MAWWQGENREQMVVHLTQDHLLAADDVKGSHQDLISLHNAVHEGAFRKIGIRKRPRNRFLKVKLR